MLSELEVMKSLKPHPHVVRLIGCCTEKGKRHFFLFISIMLFIFVVACFDFTHFNDGNEMQPLLFLMLFLFLFFFLIWGRRVGVEFRRLLLITVFER